MSNINKIKEGYSEMNILRTQPGDIIIGYFNWHEISIDEARELHKMFCKILPENVTAVTMPADVYYAAYNKSDFIDTILDTLEQNLSRNEYIQVLEDELYRLNGDDLK